LLDEFQLPIPEKGKIKKRGGTLHGQDKAMLVDGRLLRSEVGYGGMFKPHDGNTDGLRGEAESEGS
jgi:hypothetical protein